MDKPRGSIRWRQRDREALRKRVRNYNDKIRRVQKNHPEWADLQPPRITLKETMSQIETRKDFNEVMKSLEMYSKRGMEKPAEGTTKTSEKSVYEVTRFKQLEAKRNREKRKRAKELAEKPMLAHGEEVKRSKDDVRKPQEENFTVVERDPISMTRRDFDVAMEIMEREMRDSYSMFRKAAMKQNYIKALYDAGFSDDITDLVRQTDLDEFIDTVNRDSEAHFDFIYSLEEFDLKAEYLEVTWQAALKRSKRRDKGHREKIQKNLNPKAVRKKTKKRKKPRKKR